MKLITLNAWGAIVREPFMEFVRNRQDIDIFCFQELYNGATVKLSEDQKEGVSPNLFSEIKELLPHHRGFFRPVLDGVYGVGAFVKDNIEMVSEGEVPIHTNTEYSQRTGHHSRNMQWLKINKDEKTYTVLNIHGLWNGMGKADSPARLIQSKRIREFMDTLETPKILCGDFNLRPDTESITIVEKGMTNLVKEYGVENTRTSFYTKPEKFADYIFTSPEINVHHFEVLEEEVSDHAALLVDFD